MGSIYLKHPWLGRKRFLVISAVIKEVEQKNPNQKICMQSDAYDCVDPDSFSTSSSWNQSWTWIAYKLRS
ncbi:hypothetical protein SUGI_0607020 [Cryptomeria japonica]|nr:hypothetical protein SUGI_0607020 [Cryptomeria japonica]